MCLQIRLCTLLFMGFSVLKKSREMLVFLAGCSVPAVNQSYSTRLRWKQAQAKLHWMQLVHVLHLLFHSGDVFIYLAYIYSVLFSFWAKCGIPRTYSFRKKVLWDRLFECNKERLVYCCSDPQTLCQNFSHWKSISTLSGKYGKVSRRTTLI